MNVKWNSELAFFSDDIVIPNDSGKGIKVGKIREFQAFGWRDITAPITVRGVAATDPSWSRIGSTNFWAYKFGLGDYVWQPFHVPHDIVPGSAIHFHAHWIPGTAGAGEYVTWQFDYMYAKGFNQQAFDPALSNSPLVNEGTVTATEAVGPQYQHMVTETDAVSIPDLTEPDGIIYVRVGRISNTTSPLNEYSGDVFLLTADIHYQSTNMATVGKAPDFYA